MFITIFRETDLIYDEKSDHHPTMHKIEIARSIAHKIAHQWFGNTINLFWLSQFWLHDGLATLFGEEAIVKVLYLLTLTRKNLSNLSIS